MIAKSLLGIFLVILLVSVSEQAPKRGRENRPELSHRVEDSCRISITMVSAIRRRSSTWAARLCRMAIEMSRDNRTGITIHPPPHPLSTVLTHFPVEGIRIVELMVISPTQIIRRIIITRMRSMRRRSRITMIRIITTELSRKKIQSISFTARAAEETTSLPTMRSTMETIKRTPETTDMIRMVDLAVALTRSPPTIPTSDRTTHQPINTITAATTTILLNNTIKAADKVFFRASMSISIKSNCTAFPAIFLLTRSRISITPRDPCDRTPVERRTSTKSDRASNRW
uniref:30 kDa salivary protein SP19 n=1 Tax=Phlebotomus argentipes TaxID=94469 RepID=Q0ZST3_PHLAR|nr:30 kDa salivary protein SP19 [Phlebotomus argentipes]